MKLAAVLAAVAVGAWFAWNSLVPEHQKVRLPAGDGLRVGAGTVFGGIGAVVDRAPRIGN